MASSVERVASGVAKPSTGRRNGPFDPSTLGRAAHEVIAGLCADGLRHADYESIACASRLHPATQQSTVRRQAAVGWLCSVSSLYFRLFVPPEGWDLVGAEVAGAGCRFDLVWRNRFDASVVADELKTGKNPDFIDGESLTDQVRRELAGGRGLWNKDFCAVRVLVLAAPRRSFIVGPDETRRPFYDPAHA